MSDNFLSSRTGLRPRVLREITFWGRQYDVDRIVLFGSRARGDFNSRSDIDLAIYGGNFARFCLDVDEKTYTLLSYDFVNMSLNVQPELKQSIDEEGITLYEKV